MGNKNGKVKDSKQLKISLSTSQKNVLRKHWPRICEQSEIFRLSWILATELSPAVRVLTI